ncbi:MAG: dockerin type I repeat-containing protein [Oscillospiraceae bacterium]|nr:dockerin type I repeat-containing protein [Oscillospiraceae bacterium]
MKRLLSMLLALSLLLSCLPMDTMAADDLLNEGIAGTISPAIPMETLPAPTLPEVDLDTPTTDDITPATLPITPAVPDPTEAPVPATDGELYQDDVGSWHFTSFDHLSELASMTFATPTKAYYEGPENFTLSGNLVIPANLTLDFQWADINTYVTIPTGSTVICDGSLILRTLTVAGDLSVRDMLVYDALNVTGKIYNHGTIRFWDGAVITGDDKIQHTSADCLLYIEKRAEDTASLKAAVDLVNTETDPHKRYHLRLLGEVTIDDDVTIPAGCDFEIGVARLKIASSVTLTLNAYTAIICETTVEGTLVNNGGIILNDVYWNSPHLTIAQGGTYRGNGKIVIHDTYTSAPEDMFTGLDLNQFTITTTDPENHYWVLEKKASNEGLHQGANGDWHFKTFEELKQIANITNRCTAIYEGTEPLVIKEDLLISESLNINAQNSEVVVPKGVTLTMSTTLNTRKLTVAGTAYIDWVNISEAIDVPGKLTVKYDVHLYNGASVGGKENISFTLGACFHEIDVATTDELKTAVGKAITSEDRFNLWLIDNVTLSDSIIIPENCGLYLGDVILTIPKKMQLQIEGLAEISGKVIVSGTLVNNSYLYLLPINGPVLVFEKNSTYSGTGTIQISSPDYNEPADSRPTYSDFITGLDFSKFNITEDLAYWILTPKDNGPTKLPAPTDLEWGYDHDVWVGWDGAPIYETKTVPGMISWKPVAPTYGDATIEIFRQGNQTPIDVHYWHFTDEEVPQWRSIAAFILSNPDSGSYYFTVTSNGNRDTLDSDTVTSPVWSYTRPNAQLDTCTDLSWDWPYASFTRPENAVGYHIEFWFRETETSEPVCIGNNWWMDYDNSTTYGISDSMIYEYGAGYYYYTVRALTSDITKFCNSEWVTGPLYNLTETVIAVDKDLQEIVDNKGQMTDAEIRQSVQDMDTEDLKYAMLADPGVAENIGELERKAGCFGKVEVNDVSIPAGKVNVIGAGLNTPADSNEPISLIIGKPEKDHVLPKDYDDSVAVKFSMDLSNVENTEELKVPVLITMPIPKGIDPENMVILHFHADGSMDVIHALDMNIRNGNVTFVLTSFSDFVITQIAQEDEILWGDANEDGKINTKDATRILRYYAELISESDIDLSAADVNGDGKVNTKDATRILRYYAELIDSLLPDK